MTPWCEIRIGAISVEQESGRALSRRWHYLVVVTAELLLESSRRGGRGWGPDLLGFVIRRDILGGIWF
jgi:hypothetical protein